MRQPWPLARRRLALLLVPGLLVTANRLSAAPGDNKSHLPAVRWDETYPDCTFSRTDDGKLRFGLWREDVGITLAVDSQELEKVRRRHEPFFGALLVVRYRGHGSLDLVPGSVSLEFVNHFQVVQNALNPDGFAQKIQTDADEVDHQAARDVQKHPEKKSEMETSVRAFQKDAAELLEFVSKNSLRPAHLDPASPEASGWVLFSTDSKWINGWKRQEEFILRVPIEGIVYEFPFKLPPKPGEVMLRKRE